MWGQWNVARERVGGIDADRPARHSLAGLKGPLCFAILPIPGDLPMRCGHPLALAALVGGLVLASGGQGADDEPLPVYPKAGSFIPGPFHVLNLTGERKGRYHCLVCKYGNLPTVALLVRLRGEKDAEEEALKQLEPGQPLVNLFQKIDRILDKHPDGNMAGFVVFVGKRDENVPIQVRLWGDEELKQPSLLQKLNLRHLTFGFDDLDEKANSYRYFGGAEKDKKEVKDRAGAIPGEPFVKVLLYQNYKLLHDVRDFTKDKPLTDKDVEEIVADVVKMQPPPVVNRKKYKPQN
jgi:hypothetical protein